MYKIPSDMVLTRFNIGHSTTILEKLNNFLFFWL